MTNVDEVGHDHHVDIHRQSSISGGPTNACLLRRGGLPTELRDAPPGRALLLTESAGARQAGAEFVGTGLLVAIIVGSGISAERVAPGLPGLQLLAAAAATAAGLAVLIVVLQPISGAHLNPLITLADRLLGAAVPARRIWGYALAQIAGAVAGSLLANAMFGLPLSIATTMRATSGMLLAEVVATAGLVVIVFVLADYGRAALIGPAVGAYIGAAYWFTSSTAFANPAVTIGRIFSDSFAGIAPLSALGFLAAQVTGAVIGVVLVLTLRPRTTARRDRRADRAPIPAEGDHHV